MTQVDKIIALLSDNEWHCAKELQAITWSKHKRLDDVRAKGYYLQERKCEHGITLSKDWRFNEPPPLTMDEYFDSLSTVSPPPPSSQELQG